MNSILKAVRLPICRELRTSVVLRALPPCRRSIRWMLPVRVLWKSWPNTKPSGSARKWTAPNISMPIRNGSAPLWRAWSKTSLKLDPMIHQALTEDWPLSRLDSTLRAILRAGAWELKARKDVPTAVIVSEYVDIAKAFYTEDEPKLVNAVLDRLALVIRGESRGAKPRHKS